MARAGGRIGILAGGGIDETNVAALVHQTGVTELHFSGRSAVGSTGHPNPALPGGPGFGARRLATDPARLRAIIAAALRPPTTPSADRGARSAG